MKKNIGLFGGTFDPIHRGHIDIAELFVKKCNLEKCIFIPTKLSPFKTQKKDNLFSIEERVNLIKDNIKYNPKFEISEFEIKSENVISYSIDTVKYFSTKFSSYFLFFLIGTDQAIKFDKWKDYKEILKLVNVVIATRPEVFSDDDMNCIKRIFKGKEIWLNNDIIPITATKIREKIINNKYDYKI